MMEIKEIIDLLLKRCEYYRCYNVNSNICSYDDCIFYCEGCKCILQRLKEKLIEKRVYDDFVE